MQSLLGSRRVYTALLLFFCNDTPPTQIYTLSLHDALPISEPKRVASERARATMCSASGRPRRRGSSAVRRSPSLPDRKSTRLNSSHLGISYAVFCLKKKKKKNNKEYK